MSCIEADSAEIQQIEEEAILYANGEPNPISQFDSDKGGYQYNVSFGKLVAFRGEAFTITFSPQGQIVALDTANFYAAVARNRVKHENDALMHQPDKAKAAREIKALDDKYGSAQKRRQAYEKEAPTSHLYGTATLRRVLSNMVVPLATGSVRPGDAWTGPVMIDNEGPMKMIGGHTLESIEDDVCMIRVEAQRTLADKPDAMPDGRTFAEELEGAYSAILTVDRSSGCLLNREAVMDLGGSVTMPQHPAAGSDGTIPVTITASVTVDSLQ